MNDFRPVLYVVGVLLCLTSLAMILPMIVDLVNYNQDWKVFLFSSFFTFFIGIVLIFSFKNPVKKITLRQAFLLTVLSWTAVSFFSSIPFMYSESQLSFTNAFFESISGVTTTGATVINGLDNLPKGILIWRSLLQWFGGIGIILLALSILPMLHVGGMQLFHMESDDPYEKSLPKVSKIVIEIAFLYLALTVCCAILYFLSGMSGFDAFAHAMTTIATGGFSTSDQSFAKFSSDSIEWICVIFMILGSLPFAVYLKSLHGDFKSFFNDDQIKLFFGLTFILVAAMTTWLITISNQSLKGFNMQAKIDILKISSTS